MKNVMKIFMIMMVMICIAGCSVSTEQEKVTEKNDNVQSEKEENSSSIQNNEGDEQNDESDSLKDPLYELYYLDITDEWDDEAGELKENDEWLYYVCRKGDLGAVWIYRYKGLERDIVIPDTIDGYPVISVLGYSEMYGVKKTFTSEYPGEEITNIQFPDSIYYANDSLFVVSEWYDNQPDGEIYINKVFLGYKGQAPVDTEINIKDGTLSICNIARCKNVKKIVMPDSVLKVGNSAFFGCDNLEEIQLSKNLIGIGGYSFEKCPKLKEIYIPKTVSESMSMFVDCTLEKVYYEGTKSEWNAIFPAAVQTKNHPFELEAEIPFPY